MLKYYITHSNLINQKLIQLFLLSLLMLLQSCHATKSIYPDRLLEHRHKRIAEFKQENSNLTEPNYIVLLGNSLTEGFHVNKYFPSLPMLNRGIVADHTGIEGEGILQRLDESVYKCRPSLVLLLIGVNDLADKTYSPRQIAFGTEKIIRQIQEFNADIKIYLQSALPATGKYAHLNSLIIEYNHLLQNVAERANTPFINLHPHFTNNSGELKSDYTRDGIHLTDAGYAVWKELLQPYLLP